MAGTVASDVEMANVALDKLYEPPINAFDNSSKASRWFARNYQKYRDIMLEQHYWNFSMELVFLAEDTVKPPFRWSTRYKKPTDCLTFLPPTVDGRRESYLVPHQDMGNYILCNQKGGLHLEYVRRVTNEGQFTALFVDAFAWFLAQPLAHVIEGKNSLVQTMQVGYRASIRKAQTMDAMQGTPEPEPPHSYLETRQMYDYDEGFLR